MYFVWVLVHTNGDTGGEVMLPRMFVGNLLTTAHESSLNYHKVFVVATSPWPEVASN